MDVPLLPDDEEFGLEVLLLGFPLGCLSTVFLLVPHETKNKANIKLANKNFFIVLTNALS